MKFDMTSMDGAAAGSVELDDAIFGLEPRADLIARMVRWQLAKRQAGDHRTLGRAEINRTGKKMYKQKGTGGARHGSARVPQFRGGGRAMGPVVRSHAHDLPKKVRALALRHALSAKVRAGGLVVWEKAELVEGKTKVLRDFSPRPRSPMPSSSTAPRSTRTSPSLRATFPSSTSCRPRASMSTTSCAARNSC